MLSMGNWWQATEKRQPLLPAEGSSRNTGLRKGPLLFTALLLITAALLITFHQGQEYLQTISKDTLNSDVDDTELYTYVNSDCPEIGQKSETSVGSCQFLPCYDGRNAQCERQNLVFKKCMCRTNYCALTTKGGLGKCSLPVHNWTAKVVQVSDDPQQFPAPHNQVRTAVSLSGGGARAAALTVGVIRALENLDVMKNVDALSSVSGSLFVSIPYMFADSSTFGGVPGWGVSEDPSTLDLHTLDYDTCPLATPFSDGWGGTWGTVKIFKKVIGPSLLEAKNHLSFVWRKLMRKQFLEKFGLGGKDCMMAASDDQIADIKARNPQLNDDSWCFLKPQPGKPKVYVIGAAILGPINIDDELVMKDAASFQVSPDYSGSPYYTNYATGFPYQSVDSASAAKGLTGLQGGGLIETFAFGAKSPATGNGEGDQEVMAPYRPFFLGDAMAFATYADFLGPVEDALNLQADKWSFTPSFDYWPVGSATKKEDRFFIGDAGFIEDTGLLPMLQRQAKKVATFMFVGPGQGLNPNINWCALVDEIPAGTFHPETFKAAGNIADSVYVMFGYGYDDGKWHKSHNTVFKQSDMFDVACEAFKLQRQGKPLVFKKTLMVQDNAYWGIKSYEADIIFYYNAAVPEFLKLLPQETVDDVTNGELKGFPTDLPAGLFIKPKVIKLMGALTEYSIMQNADLFKDFFS